MRLRGLNKLAKGTINYIILMAIYSEVLDKFTFNNMNRVDTIVDSTMLQCALQLVQRSTCI